MNVVRESVNICSIEAIVMVATDKDFVFAYLIMMMVSTTDPKRYL